MWPRLPPSNVTIMPFSRRTLGGGGGGGLRDELAKEVGEPLLDELAKEVSEPLLDAAAGAWLAGGGGNRKLVPELLGGRAGG
mmetsp:Transcript_85616/g.169920  ORF Transcript_85616/g.169920 Transcript_85616/m.169920 type:complete len:82 (-) Transcript_85616:178-423(-)